MTTAADREIRPGQDRPGADTFFDVQIEVSFSMDPEPAFQFSAFVVQEGVTITEDGEIDIQVPGPVRLHFNLTPESGVEWQGIQLGWFGPTVTDTGGGRYPMPEHPEKMPKGLPMRIEPSASSQGQTLIVVDYQDPPCEVLYYSLAVRDPAGGSFRHDPKIYNKVPGGPGPGPRQKGSQSDGGPRPEPAQSRD